MANLLGHVPEGALPVRVVLKVPEVAFLKKVLEKWLQPLKKNGQNTLPSKYCFCFVIFFPGTSMDIHERDLNPYSPLTCLMHKLHNNYTSTNI